MSQELEATRRRVQLDFSPEAIERLESIRNLSDSRTNTEVVRNALRLYEWFLLKKKEGNKILLEKEDDVREVELIF